MDILAIQLLNGLSFGVLLFLLAAGLSLMFGLMRIVNMAHGSYYIIGAYLGYSIAKYTGNFTLAILGGALVVGLIGFFMQRYLFFSLYKQDLEQVLLTFGFIYIFGDISRIIWGGAVLSIDPPPSTTGTIDFLGAHFPVYRLAITVAGFILAIALWFFQEKTRLGAMIRAGTDDEEMVRGLGINISTINTLVFSLGAALAGLSGTIGAPMLGIYPGLDLEILIFALIVMVIGGIGSLTGAFLGSLLIGMADSFGKAYIPDFAIYTVYAAMALVLIFKPSGLLGRKE